MTDTVTLRRRMLGTTLRQYRENQGYALEDAARILECDRSKISRIETGQRSIRPKELRELLTEYGVNEAQQQTLAAIAHRKAEQGWWEAFAEVLPEAFREYLAMEKVASRILIYQPQQIPELLQTQQYAAAVAGANHEMPHGRRILTAEATVTRQQVILGDRQAELEVIIGEGALLQMVGGTDVMRAQRAKLAELASDDPHITIQVLPLTAGAHAVGGTGPLTILRFEQVPDFGVVHLAGLEGGVCLVNPTEVIRYQKAFTQAQASALTQQESAHLLKRTAGK
jgi:transcriptional regulator with XRE-family HTH domain